MQCINFMALACGVFPQLYYLMVETLMPFKMNLAVHKYDLVTVTYKWKYDRTNMAQQNILLHCHWSTTTHLLFVTNSRVNGCYGFCTFE